MGAVLRMATRGRCRARSCRVLSLPVWLLCSPLWPRARGTLLGPLGLTSTNSGLRSQILICEMKMELCKARSGSLRRQSSVAQAHPRHCLTTPQMEGRNQPITQREKLRPAGEGRCWLSWGGGEGRAPALHLRGPLVTVVSVERKPEPCPVGFFITRILSSFHGNQLWAPGRRVAACGDCSDFPLPSPPLKPSGSSSRCPREGLPQSCAPVPKPQTWGEWGPVASVCPLSSGLLSAKLSSGYLNGGVMPVALCVG